MTNDEASATDPTARRRSDGFRALRQPGYRIYFAGMLIRGTAVWMQLVSVPWFALQLGATPAQLGLVVGLQFLPSLFLSPVAGVVADRLDRARVLLTTQTGAFLNAGAFALFAVTGHGSLLFVALLALVFGMLNAIELPARQAYLTELVPKADVTSAVSLHATAWNTTRFIGPGVAGLLIATVGVAGAFAASSVMAIGVAGSVLILDRYRHALPAPTGKRPSILASLAEGARFSFQEPRIRWPLVYIAATGMLGIQAFQTLSPLYVSRELGLSGGAYGAFMALWGGGAVAAAYLVTMFARGDRWPWLIGGGAGLAALLGVLAVVGSPVAAFVVVIALGFAQIAVVQNALVTVQQAAPDAMRGRVMGLYTTIFQGTSPFGAFFAGWLAELVGVRLAMATGAALLGLVVLAGAIAVRRNRGSWGRAAIADG
jgi:MFS family permease